ncbi:MAG: universal stress protein [Bacteroidota bacterium]
MFHRICLAVAFSPRTEALVAEAAALCNAFGARLTIVHVGKLEAERLTWLGEKLREFGIADDAYEVVAESGTPATVILEACRTHQIDLLVAGALHHENLLQYYIGSVGRTILRKAPCSVLILTDPKNNRQGFRQIVMLAEDTPYLRETVSAACTIGNQTNDAHLHLLRELKMFSLTLAANEQQNEEEYSEQIRQMVRDEVMAGEELINGLAHDGLHVNVKVISGKTGFEVKKFVEKKEADLLVVGAPARRFYFLDRVFKNDLEYLFADLPCNIMVVKPRKKS